MTAGPPPELAPFFALMEVAAQLEHGMDAQLRREGDLSFVQFQVLALLNSTPDGRATMTALADRLVHSRSGLTYQARRLEEAGLIARSPAPHDERSTLLTLTAAGRERFMQVVPGHIAVIWDLLLNAIDEPDRAELSRILDRVLIHMHARPPRSASRNIRPQTGVDSGEGNQQRS